VDKNVPGVSTLYSFKSTTESFYKAYSRGTLTALSTFKLTI